MVRVAFLGPPGTYSHQVALSLYPATGSGSTSRSHLVPCRTITEAAEFALGSSVSAPESQSTSGDSERRLAVVPIENSTHGPVTETVAVLKAYGERARVIQTTKRPISHALLVGKKSFAAMLSNGSGGNIEKVGPVADAKLARIETIMSHEQALGQCKHFLDRHLPLTKDPAKRLAVNSTADAVRRVVQDDEQGILSAAIASEICATEGIYEVEIARSDIQDRDDNVTTFVTLAASDEAV